MRDSEYRMYKPKAKCHCDGCDMNVTDKPHVQAKSEVSQ